MFYDFAHPLPGNCPLARSGTKLNDAITVLLDSERNNAVPSEGQFRFEMPESIRDPMLTCPRRKTGQPEMLSNDELIYSTEERERIKAALLANCGQDAPAMVKTWWLAM